MLLFIRSRDNDIPNLNQLISIISLGHSILESKLVSNPYKQDIKRFWE